MVTDILDDLLAPADARQGPDAPGRCCERPTVRACASCGRHTCREHLWTMLGVCDTCAAEDRVARFQRTAVPEEQNWLDGA